MALIEANRLTVTLPGGPEDPPADDLAADRIRTWLEQQYGYRPPVEHMEGHGWSERWRVGGKPAPGWRFDAVIPRHLGPAPAGGERSRAHHPANQIKVPPVAGSRSTSAARAGRADPGSRRTRPRPSPAVGLDEALSTLFPDLEPRPS